MDDATKRIMVWGPATPTDNDLNDAAEAVLNLMTAIAETRSYEPVSQVHHLDYERYVERPRRQGRNPMWDAMLAEAYAHNPQAIHKAG